MNQTKIAKKIDYSTVNALETLIVELGFSGGQHDTQGRLIVSEKDLVIVADKLAKAAGRAHPWNVKTLRNVLNGNAKAGGELLSAIMALGASLDGLPMVLAQSHVIPSGVRSVEPIRDDAIVFGKCKPCANPSCGIWIVTNGRRKYCSDKCGKAARKVRSDDVY